ncbi:MAG TPA: aspartyl protease family protein [Anaeromyxobacteraceae bacterium]|nr:aspartyl protease family protein [Anaeromyxobacteraceae bacterium]
MRPLAFPFLLALLAAPSAGPARADPSPAPSDVLARAKDAAGGNAWNGVRTMRQKGTLATSGLAGSGESYTDLVHGRYMDRFSLGPASGAEGFDGKTAWSMDSSRQVREESGGDTRLGAVDEAFRRSVAYWFPERARSTATLRSAREGDRSLFVLTITPEGGRPFDMWIDANTYLVDRFVEKMALETRTTFLSDYRAVGGIKLPFRSRSTNGEAKYDQLVEVTDVALNELMGDAMFAMPAPPPPDFAIAGGKTSTAVPLALVNNHIYIEAKLNGQGPFRLLCDTGGANIVTPEVAKKIGLRTEGALQGRGVGEKSEDIGLARVETVAVGDATVRDQVFAVYPMGQLSDVEGLSVDGLIGYEVFKRFVVEVNYGSSQLVLMLPSAFRYQGKGIAVPFQFNNHIPQVEGALDGLPGKFDIDTGSRSSVDLLGPFVVQHDLRKKYATTSVLVTGWGVGGPARSYVTRARELRLGEVVVRDPVLLLSAQEKGAFSDPYVAGNVGGGVLRRFNVTFDYGAKRMYLEPNANDRVADSFDRSGMWINAGNPGFAVVDVLAGGPADAAGIRAGDRIVAVDGVDASRMSLSETRELLRTRKPGAEVRLVVEASGKRREVILVLRELA